MRVDRVKEDQVAEAVELFTAAFLDDPVWVALVPQRARRVAAIRDSFRRKMRSGSASNVVVAVDEVEGVSTVLGGLNYELPASQESQGLVTKALSTTLGLVITRGAPGCSPPAGGGCLPPCAAPLVSA